MKRAGLTCLLVIIIAGALLTACGGGTAAYKRDLKKDDPAVRQAAIKGLYTVGAKKVNEILPDLFHIIQYDRDPEVRRLTIELIGGVKPNMTTELNSTFVLAINDANADVRCAAIGQVMELTPIPPNFLTMLQRRLTDEDERVRDLCVSIFIRVGKSGARILSAGLKSPDSKMRTVVIETLGKLSGDAQAIIPKLKEVQSNDSDSECRLAAAAAIDAISKNN